MTRYWSSGLRSDSLSTATDCLEKDFLPRTDGLLAKDRDHG